MDWLITGYVGLFASAFIAATLLPFYSEAVLAALQASGSYNTFLLWAAATTGNTLGAWVNWALGRWLYRYRDRRWFPVSEHRLDRAVGWFNRWGIWSLLMAWAPIGGDQLTFVAGVLRVGMWRFLLLVGIGKGARYAVVLGAVEAIAALWETTG